MPPLGRASHYHNCPRGCLQEKHVFCYVGNKAAFERCLFAGNLFTAQAELITIMKFIIIIILSLAIPFSTRMYNNLE